MTARSVVCSYLTVLLVYRNGGAVTCANCKFCETGLYHVINFVFHSVGFIPICVWRYWSQFLSRI